MINHSAPTLNGLLNGVVDRLKSAGMGYYLLLLITLVMILAAAGIGLVAMFKGHDAYYNVTREIPWGILISTYVFFVVTSTGPVPGFLHRTRVRSAGFHADCQAFGVPVHRHHPVRLLCDRL